MLAVWLRVWFELAGLARGTGFVFGISMFGLEMRGVGISMFGMLILGTAISPGSIA